MIKDIKPGYWSDEELISMTESRVAIALNDGREKDALLFGFLAGHIALLRKQLNGDVSLKAPSDGDSNG